MWPLIIAAAAPIAQKMIAEKMDGASGEAEETKQANAEQKAGESEEGEASAPTDLLANLDIGSLMQAFGNGSSGGGTAGS